MTQGNHAQQLADPSNLLGRYRLIRELGRGGMGVVHEAHDTALQRSVAVKVLHKAGVEAEARFRWEVRIVAEMDHPGIVPVYDFGQDDGVSFFVMPLVRGKTLRTLLEQGPLSESMTLSICAQVADALDYSHARGVIHRDVKPKNILILAADPRVVHVKVMDFGVAVRSGHTQRNPEIAGTPGYLAPEQIRCEVSDARTDVYALGVVLYECLTGAELFGGTITMKLLSALTDEPRSPRALASAVSEETESLVLRCLSKRLDDRPESAGALAEALRDAMEGVRSSAQVRIEPRPLSEPRVPALLGVVQPRSFPMLSETLVDLRGAAVQVPLALERGDVAATIASDQGSGAGRSDAAGTAEQLGELLLRNGDYPAAEMAFRDAYAVIHARVGAVMPAEEARHLLRLAHLAYRLGDYEEALAHGLVGVGHLGRSEPLLAAELFAVGALACCMAGRFDEAAALLGDGFSRLAAGQGPLLARADPAAVAIT
ncbi:MAG: serine/threonine-protein kinase, partial [Byssovorax sp.]